MAGGSSRPDNTPINSELIKLGGFGKYQIFITIVIVLGMHSGALIAKAFPILEKAPQEPNGYICTNSTTEYPCDPYD